MPGTLPPGGCPDNACGREEHELDDGLEVCAAEVLVRDLLPLLGRQLCPRDRLAGWLSSVAPRGMPGRDRAWSALPRQSAKVPGGVWHLA